MDEVSAGPRKLTFKEAFDLGASKFTYCTVFFLDFGLLSKIGLLSLLLSYSTGDPLR